MRLFLASYLHPDLVTYLTGRILYIDDAAVEMREAPFAQEELKTVGEAAEVLVPVTVSQMALADFRKELELADCVYVASGETFRLLHALKSTGADQLLVDAVRAGKLYAGSSAGALRHYLQRNTSYEHTSDLSSIALWLSLSLFSWPLPVAAGIGQPRCRSAVLYWPDVS